MNPVIASYLTGQYVFHGSSQAALSCLIPNKPHDVGDDPRNKEEAVYATQDIAGAIIFSLIGGLGGPFWVTRSECGETLARFPRHFSGLLSSNTGSLYVLNKSDFTVRERWQCKSFAPVTPVAEIIVTVKDFLDFGGRVEFE